MFRTLFGRLSAALVALSLLLSAALVVVLQSSHRSSHLESEQRLHQGLAAHLAARMDDGEASIEATFEYIRELRLLNPMLAVYMLDADGNVLRSSIPDAQVQQRRVRLAPIIQFLGASDTWPLLGDDPSAYQGEAIFSVARMANPSAGEFLYVVLGRVKQDGSLFTSPERSRALREALALTLANVFAALLASVVVVGFITRPLRRLVGVMHAFDAASFNGSARYGERPGPGTDIARLGAIFDSMADRITQQMNSLRRASEARRALYAGISHDLETPLTALHGYVDTLLMREDSLPTEERMRYLTIVRRQSEQLRELVGQIGDLARLEHPEPELQRQQIDLERLFQEIIEDLQPLLDDKRLKASFRVDASGTWVTGDASLLRRAFANILVNAIQAAPASTEIAVGISDNVPESVTVTISDQGPGLSPEDVRRMFEPHYRGARATGPGSPGLGLGLAIARKIFELHDADLTARNLPGGGAEFAITLKKAGRRGLPA